MPRHNDTTLRRQWTAIAARLDPERTARLHLALQAVRRTARANAERAYRAGAIGRATEDRIIAIYATHILRATGGRTPKLQPAPEPLTEPATTRAAALAAAAMLGAPELRALREILHTLATEAERRRDEDWRRAKPANTRYWHCVAEHAAQTAAELTPGPRTRIRQRSAGPTKPKA